MEKVYISKINYPARGGHVDYLDLKSRLIIDFLRNNFYYPSQIREWLKKNK
jgi:hypothetical protein